MVPSCLQTNKTNSEMRPQSSDMMQPQKTPTHSRGPSGQPWHHEEDTLIRFSLNCSREGPDPEKGSEPLREQERTKMSRATSQCTGPRTNTPPPLPWAPYLGPRWAGLRACLEAQGSEPELWAGHLGSLQGHCGALLAAALALGLEGCPHRQSPQGLHSAWAAIPERAL